MERRLPTQQEVESYLRDRRNWGRWGKDDDIGAINLITAEKRAAAAGLVRSGRAVSLSRHFPKAPGPGNQIPAQHFMRIIPVGTGGAASDYYGIVYHGMAATHLDALCHVWNEEGMWNGRDPSKVITFDGATFGSVDRWGDGIITRAVFLDIPKLRGESYVTQEKPVHGWDLEDAVSATGLTIQPGDAVIVYSGRDAWQEAHPNTPYGASGPDMSGAPQKPGLHASCIPFFRDNDVSTLVWDMMDFAPKGYDLPWTVHGVIFAYGMALLDNALLAPLAKACAEEGRYEFMLMIAPLKVAGGTGGPANPIALF